MDLEYTWILRQGKTCHRFRLLFSMSFMGLFVQTESGTLRDKTMNDN